MSDLQILVVGDLHYQEDPTMPTLLNKKIDNILSEGEYDCCVLLGDVLHRFKNIDQPALSLVCKLFEIVTKHCPLFVLVGNHDYINASQFLTENHSLMPFKHWPKVKIIDTPQIIKMTSDIRILLVPYIPKGQFLEALETVNKWESVNMIFAHQEFQGCNMGGHVCQDGDAWSEKFPPIISGHAHTKHVVEPNITYIGMPYDLGYDTEQRFVAQVTFKGKSGNPSGGASKIKYIPTNMPQKKLLRMSLEQVKKWAPEGIDYYKIKIICTKEEFKQFAKSAHSKDLRMAGVKIVHVAMDPEKVEEILQKRQGCETYKQIFHKLTNEEGLNDVLTKIIN